MGLFDRFKKKPDSSQSPDPEVEALIGKLKAPEWKARFDAAQALGALRARAAPAQAALEDATCDEHNEVCTAAADALSSIRRALDGR